MVLCGLSRSSPRPCHLVHNYWFSTLPPLQTSSAIHRSSMLACMHVYTDPLDQVDIQWRRSTHKNKKEQHVISFMFYLHVTECKQWSPLFFGDTNVNHLVYLNIYQATVKIVGHLNFGQKKGLQLLAELKFDFEI